ncbi:MAG TPA: hypothetical protein VMB26_12840 [Candidatus Binataceae bacterium]|nr:hypothetical protein [Candidatus Binataceae bacterium]
MLDFILLRLIEFRHGLAASFINLCQMPKADHYFLSSGIVIVRNICLLSAEARLYRLTGRDLGSNSSLHTAHDLAEIGLQLRAP